MTTLPTLRTARLCLRALRPDDAENLHGAFGDVELMTWWSSGPDATVDDTWERVAANCDSADYPTWAITLAGGDDAALGWVVFIPRRSGIREIGYIMRRDTWGKGYAREAVSAVIDYGFGALGLRRIIADTDPDNAGSNRLLETLGFTCEGRLRGEWETHIGVRDSFIWGLLADEWRVSRTPPRGE
jgi:RimJ/RimL family protein N-acetyltransferase